MVGFVTSQLGVFCEVRTQSSCRLHLNFRSGFFSNKRQYCQVHWTENIRNFCHSDRVSDYLKTLFHLHSLKARETIMDGDNIMT